MTDCNPLAQRPGGSGSGGLAWGFCLTVAVLVLAEQYGDALLAIAAFAGAAWVVRLERRDP